MVKSDATGIGGGGVISGQTDRQETPLGSKKLPSVETRSSPAGLHSIIAAAAAPGLSWEVERDKGLERSGIWLRLRPRLSGRVSKKWRSNGKMPQQLRRRRNVPGFIITAFSQ